MHSAELGIELERTSRGVFASRSMLDGVLWIAEPGAGAQVGIEHPSRCEIAVELECLLYGVDGKQGFLRRCALPASDRLQV
jgi:hypothetical protein